MKQVCVQLPASADNVALPAFAAVRGSAVRRAAAVAVDLLHTTANPPHRHA